MLGERWTLLILRELIGGPRRYGDLRAQLPGIATNLLADRLRELEDLPAWSTARSYRRPSRGRSTP